jgi:dimethylamine/trimethylamine dehydrogenase
VAPDRLVIATGARWTRMLYSPMELPAGQLDHAQIFTPDDIAAGRVPDGPTLVFDFDNYYMGGVLAEHLAGLGVQVRTLRQPVTRPPGPSCPMSCRWYTGRSPSAVPVTTLHLLTTFDGETATLKQLFTGDELRLACRSIVIVGMRVPRGELLAALQGREQEVAAAGIRSIERAGDTLAPGAIVHAIHSGHLVGRELELGDRMSSYRRDFPIVERAGVAV